MTTSPRIFVSEQSVRAALEEWHRQHAARTEPERAEAHTRVEISDSETYAAEHASFLFCLLQKHAEPRS